MSHPTPTRDGNWHVINGELIDVKDAPPPKRVYTRKERGTPISKAPADTHGDGAPINTPAVPAIDAAASVGADAPVSTEE